MINCSVGITAYNEEANIGKLIEALQGQRLIDVTISEILVVASGCTDRTEEIALDLAQAEPRIRLLFQPLREGKASAINYFMEEASTLADVLVLSSADLVPDENTLEMLVSPFANPEVGITASRPVPVNDKTEFTGFMAHLLWDLHHAMNENGGFKAGEMIAFRPVFKRIPNHTAVDEASIEPLIRGQGYQVQYVGDAIVYNKGPDTIKDFLKQRRRIYAGHLEVKDTLGYSVSSMSGFAVLNLFLSQLDFRPKPFFWSWRVALLEAYGRWLGRRDYLNHHNHTVWEIATSTKEVK
ncbi:MAG: glycosyltransferase [Chloroflexota bacterium]